MMARHLPVAPRPYRDELLSSWLARVACRYGLTHQALVGWLADDGESLSPIQSIDDRLPTPEQVRQWARNCGVDPERLHRLSLSRRHPQRPNSWYVSSGPDWPPSPTIGAPPVCLACLAADHAAGCDARLRADWALAEHCICPVHGQLLYDRCLRCGHRLSVTFRLREGRACAVCRWCEAPLVDRGGEDSAPRHVALIETALSIQRQVAQSADGESRAREQLARALATLWAPLDRPTAARPTLALWLNESGWRCPYEVRHVVGAKAPLGQLPVGWRFVTLLALNDVFGADPDEVRTISEIAGRLTRRAASRRIRSVLPPPRPIVTDPLPRSSAEYERLANQILADPGWIDAQRLPRRKRDRARARLIDAALSRNVRPAAGS
ncbi:TniQ family protein (plasmid) [Rhizobium sp. CB3171]|uniref:TniQ family protein n=1 Tax=Rhizobium sp. CB3171 TaxID=3039157 RepID=UPI0024B1828D|nr:TniQ family protein [Rhizobium sp. CB3171]WFU07365.1 TniQ family protein [Rhizobium sp. CB3171]